MTSGQYSAPSLSLTDDVGSNDVGLMGEQCSLFYRFVCFRWQARCDDIGRLEKARDEATRDVKRDGVKFKFPEVPLASSLSTAAHCATLFDTFARLERNVTHALWYIE